MCCHNTLWNINARKQAVNDKLQGTAVTYLRRGGIVNNQIKKSLLPSLPVNFFKSVNNWQSYKQEGCSLVHFVCLATTRLKDEKSAWHNPPFACNCAKYSLI